MTHDQFGKIKPGDKVRLRKDLVDFLIYDEAYHFDSVAGKYLGKSIIIDRIASDGSGGYSPSFGPNYKLTPAMIEKRYVFGK